jgi:hypothetical protein
VKVAAWIAAALAAGAAPPTLGYVYASPQDTHGRYYVSPAESYVVEVATGSATESGGAFLPGSVVFRTESAATAAGTLDWKVDHPLAPGLYTVHAGARSGGAVAWSPITTFAVVEGCLVPRVRGRTVAAARAALSAAGCTPGGARRIRSRLRRGLVAGTVPRAGLRVPTEAPVVLLVSRGQR